MKTFITFLLTLFSASLGLSQYSQYEVYGAGVVSDTVKLWDLNIASDCQSKFMASLTLPPDSIVLTEQDTSTMHAICDCFYDVNASLTGLANGNYEIVIYRLQLTKYQYAKDTLILVASFSFSLGGSVAQNPTAHALASSCHKTPVSVREMSPSSTYLLLTSYPNPFNPKTTIHFSLPRAEEVKLEVFNNLGQHVVTLVNEKKPAGQYETQFDANALASGVYVCRLTAGPDFLTSKLVLVK